MARWVRGHRRLRPWPGAARLLRLVTRRDRRGPSLLQPPAAAAKPDSAPAPRLETRRRCHWRQCSGPAQATWPLAGRRARRRRAGEPQAEVTAASVTVLSDSRLTAGGPGRRSPTRSHGRRPAPSLSPGDHDAGAPPARSSSTEIQLSSVGCVARRRLQRRRPQCPSRAASAAGRRASAREARSP